MRGSRPLRLAPLVLAGVVLAVPACGDDSAGGTASTASETPDASEASDPTGTTGGASRAGEPGSCGTPTDALTGAPDAPGAAGLDAETAGTVPPPGDPSRFPRFDEVAIAVEAPSGEVTTSCVLLAVTGEQRRRGLMEVTDLAGYAGMLFVADDEHTQSFWMRNTPMPLSIAWFDDEGTLVTALDMEPCGDDGDCPSYGSDGPARFALEVPQGQLADVGVVDGSTLQVGGS